MAYTKKAALAACVGAHLRSGVCVLSNGEIAPITNMFDEDEYETEQLDEVVAVVAGPDSKGRWYSLRILEADQVTH